MRYGACRCVKKRLERERERERGERGVLHLLTVRHLRVVGPRVSHVLCQTTARYSPVTTSLSILSATCLMIPFIVSIAARSSVVRKG